MGKHAILKVVSTAVVIGILPLAGCVSKEVCYGEQGTPVPRQVLNRVERESTSKDWLIAMLGEPARQSMMSDGTEILEYNYTRKEDYRCLIPFRVPEDRIEEKRTVYFEIKNGVVQDYWKRLSRS
jgi:hypothetical protein